MVRRHIIWLALVVVLSFVLHKFTGDATSNDASALEAIKRSILAGELPRARQIAFQCIASSGRSDNVQTTQCPSEEAIIKTYKRYTSIFYEKVNYLDVIKDSMRHEFYNNTSSINLESSSCWDGSTYTSSTPFGVDAALHDVSRWNECCSLLSVYKQKPPKCSDPSNTTSQLCCYFSFGSDNYLALPALKEPSITILLGQQKSYYIPNTKQQFIEIEQEGQLSLYDVAGVLWPSGYLLGLCLNDPIFCGVPEIIKLTERGDFTLALELGAGVGFPSVVFARYMSNHFAGIDATTCKNDNICTSSDNTPVVIATDSSRMSLGLVVSNSHRNNVGHLVNPYEVNHLDLESLSRLQKRFFPGGGGFDMIFGSSLQGFFDRTWSSNAGLWRALDILLSRTNPNAIIIFAHVKTGNERIEVPTPHDCNTHASFEIIRRISGDTFLMSTRDGSASDFELVILRRRAC